jgi:predicted enzyme related to lactoylglutathione lyase
MKRVTNLGGVFFKAADPKAQQEWYRTHLGIDVQPWGGAEFKWRDDAGEPLNGQTLWCIMNGEYFSPSQAPFMINYQVEDVRALVEVLRAEGCEVVGEVEENEFGAFAWVMDPEGNKLELWQPPV